MRRLALCLVMLASCSESHAGRKPPHSAAADTYDAAEDASLTDTDADDPVEDPAEDARAAGPRQTDAASEPAPPNTGNVAAITALGSTIRAVRADGDQVSFSARPIEPCDSALPGAGAALDVTVTHQDCEMLGPIEVNASDPAALMLTVWLWRSNAPCGDDAIVSRRTLQLGLGPDCQRVCDNAIGCQRGARVACSEEANCAPGLACIDGRCRWSTELGQDTRHVCRSHAECAPGLLCVEGDRGEPRCDVPCNATDMVCPGAHYCTRDASHTSAHWVCEWGGE